MIPQHIHHIWLGPKKVPQEWIYGWRTTHPNWGYTLWREKDINPLITTDLSRAWKYYLRRGNGYDGAADVARVAILLVHGGVYVDIDSEVLFPLEGAPFMEASFFAGYEGNVPGRPGRIANGTIGSEKNHPILRSYAKMIAFAKSFEPAWDTIGGTMLTKAVAENKDVPGVMILPARTFYPENSAGTKASGDELSYTRHLFATAHNLYKDMK